MNLRFIFKLILFKLQAIKTNLLCGDDESFVEQFVLNEKQFLDMLLRPEPVAGHARHLQHGVDVLNK